MAIALMFFLLLVAPSAPANPLTARTRLNAIEVREFGLDVMSLLEGKGVELLALAHRLALERERPAKHQWHRS